MLQTRTEHTDSPADYRRVERAIAYLEEHYQDQPPLDEIASHLGLSPYHFQRLFRRWAGISPKRFVQFLTLEHAKGRLAASDSVLDASYEAGLSGPGRLHDLFVNLTSATPGEFKRGGQGLRLAWGIAPSPFGTCFAASTARGLTKLAFTESDGTAELAELRRTWPQSEIVHDVESALKWAGKIFARAPEGGAPLDLFVFGTAYQVRVWEALLRIPLGSVTTYSAIAEAIHCTGAGRAAARAIAANPVAFLIPCHRVILKSGRFGGYRWGERRKRALLAWEAARSLGDSAFSPSGIPASGDSSSASL